MKFIGKFLSVFGAIFILSLFAGVNSSRSDGGIFPMPDRYARETKQAAIVYFQNNIEDLVLKTTYRGNSSDFAWVIPTPSQPQIFKSNSQLFADLENITAAGHTEPDIIYNKGLSGMAPGAARPKVEVVAEKTVDIYDTAVVKATDADALAKWLKDNGYAFPTDKSSELQGYVDDGWYFTAAKIQNALADSADVKKDLANGTITPLRIEFATDKIIYPMKLTQLSVNYAEKNSPPISLPSIDSSANLQAPVPPPIYQSTNMSINLYVISNFKAAQDLFTINWANWLSKDDIQKLNDESGENWITGQKLFLTELDANLDLSALNGDLIIVSAPDNSVYPIPAYEKPGFWLTNLLAFFLILLVGVLSPTTLLFAILVILQIFVIKKRKWAYVLALIYEIFACLCIAVVLLFAIILVSLEPRQVFSTEGYLGGNLALIIFLAVGVFLTFKMLKRYKKVFSALSKPEDKTPNIT